VTCRVEADHARHARAGLGKPEEHEDRRGLAGAVLAKQPEDLAGLDVEVEVVDRDEVAVALAQPPGDDRPGVLRELDSLTLPEAALLRDAALGAGLCRRGLAVMCYRRP